MSSDTWYKSWFNELYLPLYQHRDSDEASQFVDLAEQALQLESGCRVLDLCCGSGRHMDIFQKKGIDTVGLDLSQFLLDKGGETGASKLLVRGEMACLPFRPVFDAVVNFFTSFGYYETDEKNAGVLGQIALVLKPGGRFLLDLPNIAHTLDNLVAADTQTLEGFTIKQTRRYDEQKKRLEKRIDILGRDQTHTYRESVRLYSAEEISAMADSAGLRLTATVDLDGNPAGPTAERMIYLGEKPC